MLGFNRQSVFQLRVSSPKSVYFLILVILGISHLPAEELEFSKLSKALEGVTRDAQEERYEIRLPEALIYHSSSAHHGEPVSEPASLIFTLEYEDGRWAIRNLESTHPKLNSLMQVSALQLTSQIEKAGHWQLECEWQMGLREAGRKVEDGGRSERMSGGSRWGEWDPAGQSRVEDSLHKMRLVFQKAEEELHLSLKLKGAVGKEMPPSMPLPSPKDKTPISLVELKQFFKGEDPKDLELECTIRDGQFFLQNLVAPNWNRGLHRVAKEELRKEGDKIVGSFSVDFQPDPWMPTDGLKRQMHYRVELGLEGERTGRYEGAGAWPSRKGSVEISGGRVLRGSFRLEDVDGLREGRLVGRGGKVERKVRKSSRMEFLEILGEALDKDAPVVNTWVPLKYANAYSEKLENQALMLLSAGWRTSAPQQEYEPSLMETQLASPLRGKNLPVLTEEKFTWFRPTQWDVLGPFQVNKPVTSAIAPLLPELIHGGFKDSVFADTRVEYGKPAILERRWEGPKFEGDAVFLSDESEKSLWLSNQPLEYGAEHPLNLAFRSVEMKGRSMVWFASTSINVDEAKVYWLAMKGREKLGVYLDGQRIFSTKSSGDAGKLNAIPLYLEKGEHRFLIRIGMDDLAYYPEKGKESFFQFFLGNGYLSTPLKVMSPPEVGSSGSGSPDHRSHEGSVPLAFDEDSGVNVAWSTRVRSGRSRPVLVEDRLIFTSWDGWVEARDSETGQLLWEKQVGGRSRPSTPAETEDGVVVHFAPGALARMTLDGQVLWRVSTGLPFANGSPPLVVGQVVLIQTMEEKYSSKGKNLPQTSQRIQARSMSNGDLLWEHELQSPDVGMAPVFPPGGRPLIVSASGWVFELDSGKRLPWNLLHDIDASGMKHLVSKADKVYITVGGWRLAFRFYEGASGMEVSREYAHQDLGGKYGDSLLHRGILWVSSSSSRFIGEPAKAIVEGINVKTGHRVFRQRPLGGESSGPLKFLSVGEQLWVFDMGLGSTSKGKATSAKFSVIQTGKHPKRIFNHSFGQGEQIMAVPLVVGGRMFLRFEDRMLAITDGDEGKMYEEEVLARYFVDTLGSTPPDRTSLIPKASHGEVGPVYVIDDALSPLKWWKSGPHSPESDPRSLEELWPLKISRDGSWSGGKFEAMDESLAEAKKLVPVRREGRELYLPKYLIDLSQTAGGRTPTITYLYSRVRINSFSYHQMSMSTRGVEVMLGGKRVVDGDVIEFRPGSYPLLLKVKSDPFPRFGRKLLDLNFRKVNAPLESQRQWMERIEVQIDKLRMISKQFPESDFGERARNHLSLFKELDKVTQTPLK